MENIDVTLSQENIENVDDVLTGPPGPAGYSPSATVERVGNKVIITITDEQGTTTAEVNDGTNGSDGQNSSLTIGTVSEGDNAEATITGQPPFQVLNLVLPRGSAGEPGTPGSTPTIEVGSVTTVSPSSPANVTNVGTSENVILNFEIPKGDTGDDSNCLSTPYVVDELPEIGDPKKFYFVPIQFTPTVVTDDTISFSVANDKIGRIDQLYILGNIEQATPPATPEALRGVVTFDINSESYTVDLGDIYLAKVNNAQDKIYNDGNDFYVHQEIGYIENYTNENITTDYISTSGSLTPGDEVYYVLDTPTDTLITDDNLINSLRIIRNMTYPSGSNTITVSADVTTEITVGYYEVDPHHQYKKYVCMWDSGFYEEIG